MTVNEYIRLHALASSFKAGKDFKVREVVEADSKGVRGYDTFYVACSGFRRTTRWKFPKAKVNNYHLVIRSTHKSDYCFASEVFYGTDREGGE